MSFLSFFLVFCFLDFCEFSLVFEIEVFGRTKEPDTFEQLIFGFLVRNYSIICQIFWTLSFRSKTFTAKKTQKKKENKS